MGTFRILKFSNNHNTLYPAYIWFGLFEVHVEFRWRFIDCLNSLFSQYI